MENQFCYLIYKTYLLENGVKEENIIEIKLDKMEFITFRNPFMLYKEITKTINKTPLDKYYLFIDEVQMAIEKKDRKSGVTATIYDILNQFKDNKNIDVYVTGSNSKMLSKDISTEFRGRSSQIHVFPLSFSEYYNYIVLIILGDFCPQGNFLLLRYIHRAYQFIDNLYFLYSLSVYPLRSSNVNLIYKTIQNFGRQFLYIGITSYQ